MMGHKLTLILSRGPPVRVIFMLLSCSLLSSAAETTGRESGSLRAPPVVVIPEVPEVHLPRLAALPPEVRNQLRDQADAATRKVLVAASQRIGSPDAAARIVPPPSPGSVGVTASPSATGVTGVSPVPPITIQTDPHSPGNK